MYDVLIIGGGAAGMTAAVFAAQRGADTAIIEKNDRLGRKLAITGKGRCNLTNNCPFEELFENIPRNPRFLYSAFAGFPPAEVMNFFTSLGVPLKTERGRRVFPVSDKAGDVVEALEKRLRQLGVTILKENARGLVIKDGKCVGARTNHGETPAKCVILASGGKSYPKTGSDGFGYELARRAGHTVIEPRASLSGLVCKDFRFADAAGLTLKNCAIKLFEGEKRLYEDFGELSFTENGLSGATVLSASAHIEDISRPHAVVVDLKPALDEKKLDARILRDFAELKGKTFGEALKKLLAGAMTGPFAEFINIPFNKKIGEITKSERQTLVNSLKNLRFEISGFRPIEEAVVTRGGVKVSEISPKTMESRLVPGLYFAGEIIDTDGYTGGFNLQIAFATGKLAGENCTF